MKKLFLAIYFSFIIIGNIYPVSARVTEMNEAGQIPQAPQEIRLPTPEGLPNPQNIDEVVSFFRNRFKNSSVSRAESLGDLNKSNSMNIQHSAEYIAQMQEQKKSTFEKIYDQAIGRISGTSQSDVIDENTVFYELAEKQQAQSAVVDASSNLAVVNVILPTGKNIIAPAREHIPYLLSSFNILPTGLIQIEEDITVVANGQKLKNGITKIIPKYSTSRANVRKKLDIQLLSVSVNGQEVPYVLEEIGDKIYVKPQNQYTLQPGVYTYKFKYLLDRKLWYYDDFAEFYWDISGSYLNLVITSANAIVSIPDGKSFMSQNVVIGPRGHLNPNRAMIASLDSNALGFASTTPILPGEGMHVLVSLDKNTFMEPGIGRKFAWFVTDYGDVLFALAGLVTILVSYMLSWRYLKRNKNNTQTQIKRTAPILRYISQGVFDKKAFVSFLLELYRKNIIDIQEQDREVLLIKKTDDISRLNKGERKALDNLFPGKESVISTTAPNVLKFKRAAEAIEKSVKLSIKLMALKLNIGYLLFSIGMLLLSELAISLIGINPLQTGMVLFSGTVMVAFYIWALKRKFSTKWIKYIVSATSVVFIVFSVLLMSIYIKPISSLIIVGMIYIIFEYSELFSRRGTMVKNRTKEADELKSYLQKNAQKISYSYEFSMQQPFIFALNLDKYYPQNEYNKQFYKLNLAQVLLSQI